MNLSDVPVSVEAKRGCGYRKAGGMYLVAPKLGKACGKLPIILERCPVCGEGITQSRAPKWVEPAKLIEAGPCLLWIEQGDGTQCTTHCPAGNPKNLGDHALLIWIGEAHYKSTTAFKQEATEMGVSRRIKSIPKGFVVGETWVLLAHPKASWRTCDCINNSDEPDSAVGDCPDCDGTGVVSLGGIFTIFRPHAIEYVCKGDETEEELEALAKRGLSPVIVKRKGENGDLGFEEDGGADA